MYTVTGPMYCVFILQIKQGVFPMQKKKSHSGTLFNREHILIGNLFLQLNSQTLEHTVPEKALTKPPSQHLISSGSFLLHQ